MAVGKTRMLSLPEVLPLYLSQAARDAIGPHGKPYADYIEQHSRELAARFPDRGHYFLTRSLGEALAGNDGD
jgi:hypothetical protein